MSYFSIESCIILARNSVIVSWNSQPTLQRVVYRTEITVSPNSARVVCLVGLESPDVTILEYKTQGELQLCRELYSVARNSVRFLVHSARSMGAMCLTSVVTLDMRS